MKGIPEGLRSRARQWGELWGVPHLADSVTVEFSPRFRSSLGLCRPVEGRVRLAAHLTNGRPELLEEVLCHELAHVAVYRLHGRSVRLHGPEWKGMVRSAGFEPRVRFHREEGGFPARAPRPGFSQTPPGLRRVTDLLGDRVGGSFRASVSNGAQASP